MSPDTEPAERGRLTVADKVIARVAGQAVISVDGASAAPRRLLGVNLGDARPDAQASVDVRVEGRTATVEATIAIAWPRSVREVTARLRQQIRDDVRRLTDVEVAQVDVDVVRFASATPPPRRVQ